jgi:hypothetical protein
MRGSLVSEAIRPRECYNPVPGEMMKPKLILVMVLLLMAAALVWSLAPASASPAWQAVPSPTPGPDGRIIYIVQPGDTCDQIAARFGVTVEYLKTANMLDPECSLRAGKQLILGVGGPASASATPVFINPTPVQPSPTPGGLGSAQVCVLMYDDANGDALRQTTEMGLAGGAVSLTSIDGQFSRTQVTAAGIDPDTEDSVRTCFTDLAPGQYTLSAAPPDGYNPTTELSSALQVAAGDSVSVDFGAQSKVLTGGETPKGNSPLLGILGAMLLLGGIGLGIYTWRMMRGK